MTKIATQIGRGEFAGKAPASGDDAVGELAGVMNVMSARIASQVESLVVEKNRLNAILLSMGEGLSINQEGNKAQKPPSGILSVFCRRPSI